MLENTFFALLDQSVWPSLFLLKYALRRANNGHMFSKVLRHESVPAYQSQSATNSHRNQGRHRVPAFSLLSVRIRARWYLRFRFSPSSSVYRFWKSWTVNTRRYPNYSQASLNPAWCPPIYSLILLRLKSWQEQTALQVALTMDPSSFYRIVTLFHHYRIGC